MSKTIIDKLEKKIEFYQSGMQQQADRLSQAQAVVRESSEQLTLMRGAVIGLQEQLDELKPDKKEDDK